MVLTPGMQLDGAVLRVVHPLRWTGRATAIAVFGGSFLISTGRAVVAIQSLRWPVTGN